MTMLDTLFGLIPAASRGQQWLAEDLQLVNWGGYDGAHRVRFSPTATLLCGGSGSGKSTLMDAYIALMMPHTTPFNGASNGGVLGRPRGSEQRNIISYGRGKLDESRTEDGTKMRVLRGDGCDTWTAVAMTWVDRDLTRFTAVRAWYIPATARILDDTVRVRATIDGPFDLRELEEAAVQHLGDAAVRAAGLATLGTDREFSAKLHATLGIGASGAGSKAMSLLARIQAGQQITTVDELYKRMVLEEPETLATADAVVEHFDELEGTRRRMVTARQQVHALEPIRDLKTKMASAANRLRLIDEVGRFGDSDSLAALWQASRRLELLREVEAESRDRKRAADELIREAETRATAAQVEHDGLAEVLRTSGGDRLETAQRELRGVETRLVRVQRDLDRLHDAVAVVQADRPRSATQFAALLQRAEDSLADAAAKATARDVFAAARAQQQAIEQEVAALEADRCQAERRRGNIPTELDTSRIQLAAAAGLGPEELPFVGELVEVRTEFEPWREAFNLALGGFATTVLIDTGRLADFRSAINSVRTPVRVRFEGVHTGLSRARHLDDRTLPGRLDYRATPFTGWLEERLEKRFGFVCVVEAAELAQHPMAVTIAGQISHGNRGEHGGHGRKNVLGFSNQRYLSDLADQIDRARVRLVEAIETAGSAVAALDAFETRGLAFRAICDLSWEQVDLAAVEAERDRWSSVITEVTSGNPEIARLRAQIAKARDTVDRLQQKVGRAKQQSEQADEQWAAIMDQVDQAEDILQAAQDAGRVLTAEQQDYLDACFDLVGPG
ncbi:ATP-binding protein, partial [Brooklawnia sp.]|uniref:ATP-binding protein n=1 Tax=Brooklawnia sp. TaxID=2699740 RepID=UPI00311DD191